MNNATGSVWVVITNLAVVRSQPDRVQSETRSAFVARTPELLVHDADGNLVRDGRWMYTWAAENRLTRVITVAGPSSSFRLVEWMYGAWGWQTRQRSYILTNGAWQVVEDLKLVDDPVLFGRHVAELNATNNALVRAYIWGLDLSETLDGAGGVGGLLWVRVASGPASGTHFVCYDGNGNVWNLVSATTGTETARYEYGPFGEPLRLSGPAARINPFRFSTKRTEDISGLVLYEYRAYSPSLRRWPNRDPWREPGFETLRRKRTRRFASAGNVYGFVSNNPLNSYDVFGLYEYEWEGNFTEAEKQAIRDSIQRVRDRANALIKQMDDNIKMLSKLCPCPAYQRLIRNLEHLKRVLEGMVKEINDPTFNLEIYRGDLGSIEARYWDSPVPWYDDELTLNNRWFGQPSAQQDSTMFHEISHGQGTGDVDDNAFNNAYFIEQLMGVDKEQWNPYKDAKRRADKECSR